MTWVRRSYLPIEFDGRVTVGDYRVASTQALLDVLEEMKEELGVDEEEEYEDEDEDKEEEEEEEEEEEGTVIEAQLRHIWQLVSDGADRIHRQIDPPAPPGVGDPLPPPYARMKTWAPARRGRRRASRPGVPGLSRSPCRRRCHKAR